VKFYAARYGRPSLTPGIYFRSLLLGYFEGIDSDRGIAWQLTDSLGLGRFVGIGLDEGTPDHTTISRTRRLIDVETHRDDTGRRGEELVRRRSQRSSKPSLSPDAKCSPALERAVHSCHKTATVRSRASEPRLGNA
jgi:Transposase domain (DUF772)